MQDTLDLTQLSARIKEINLQRQRYKRIDYFTLIAAVGIILVIASTTARGTEMSIVHLLDFLVDLLLLALPVLVLYPVTGFIGDYLLRRYLVRQATPYLPKLTSILNEEIRLQESLGLRLMLAIGLYVLLFLSASALADLADPIAAIAFIAAVVLGLSPLMQAIWSLWGPFAQGNYDAAIKRMDLQSRINPQGIIPHYFMSNTLFIAGRLESLIQTIHTGLRRSQHSVSATFWCNEYLVLLANQRIEQDDFDSATLLLESAILIAPFELSSYISLAVVYLRQGIHPERALELLDFWNSCLGEPSTSNLYLERSLRASYKLLEAQACWLTGRTTRCDAAVTVALELIDPRHKPMTADAYVNLGKLRQMQGKIAEAHDYFQKVLTVDPNGLSGQRARKLLDQLETGNR